MKEETNKDKTKLEETAEEVEIAKAGMMIELRSNVKKAKSV